MRRQLSSLIRSFAATAGALVLATTTAAPARADDAEDHCIASSLEGQILRRAGRLERARARYAECALDVCKSAGTDVKCTEWLREVEPQIPHLTFVIVDDRGAALPQAEVLLDGARLERALRVSVDPGHHTVRASLLGRTTTVELDVGLREDRVVRVVVDQRRIVPERPTPTWVLGAGAASLVGLGGVALFGGLTLAKERELDACKPICNSRDEAPLTRTAIAADVSLGVFVTFAAGAIIGYLTRPTLEQDVRLRDEAAR